MRDRGMMRARSRGFTLLELMVVVVVVAILALLAAPALRTTRNDRICFDFARTYSAIIHRARVRAGARGGAQLVAIVAGGGVRGSIALFEAIDNTPASAGGPKPQSSCKLPGQWEGVPGFVPGSPNPVLSPLIEGTQIDGTGDPTTATFSNIQSQIRLDGGIVNAAVICYTPGGNVYVGTGDGLAAAINNMQLRQPFSGVLEVRIRRTDPGNNPIGLTRRVIVAGGATPRIQSGADGELL